MPKKFHGENSKSVAARARKAEKAAEEKAHKEKLEEDAYWEDNDKHVNRKLQRKENKERKKQEEQQRKAENKKLSEEEMYALTPKASPPKVTVHQISRMEEKRKAEEKRQQELETEDELPPLEENLNRLNMDIVSGSGVDAAISALSSAEASQVDHHPEKRMAAAYKAYEETHLPQLKKEHPSLRMSQLKQMLMKDWKKSPENPMNQVVQCA